jgi:hypothetical protein
MKLELYDKNHFSVFLNKYYIEDIDFNKREGIELYLKNIISNLKLHHHIKMSGYYDVNIYVNNLYGIIMELINLDDEHLKVFGKKIDMKITFNLDSDILFKLNDYFYKDNLDGIKKEIYFYENNFYLNILNNSISDTLMMKIIENTEIIYGDKVYEILKQGKIL